MKSMNLVLIGKFYCKMQPQLSRGRGKSILFFKPGYEKMYNVCESNISNEFSLQEWVTATAIRISLTRMNTFGDEVFGDARVLKSYFFAISDLSVGARYFTTR